MKICLAQILSKTADLDYNIQHHIHWVHKAISENADLIVFPELSLTNYEPTHAYLDVLDLYDQKLNKFQELSNQHQIVIAIGMPIKTTHLPLIGMVFFKPFQDRSYYAKQLLHQDELPYFSSGNQTYILALKHKTIGFGICYESLQTTHLHNYIKQEIDTYIASVAKPQQNITKAYSHYAKMAKLHALHLLMVNAVGPMDNFISIGQSAYWNNSGEIIAKLNATEEKLLCIKL